jgi:thiol-disulfide isomerase/thioredoxin
LWRQVVADAQAIERKEPFKDVVSEQVRDFRGSLSGYERDRLFYNPNGAFEGFVQTAYVFGLDDDQDGRAAAAVDIDGDGDLDLVTLTAQDLRLFENTSAPRHFARVRLIPTGSLPHALGATVALGAGGITQRDFVKITDGFRSQVPFDLHFGLGQTTTIESIEVRWPSGKVEVWKNLPADQLLLVREGASAVEARPLERWPDSTRPRVIGAPLPTFEAERLDGGVAPVAGGRPAVINFWAPWCAPCNVELPQLVRLAGRYGNEVDFAGVSVELKDLESFRTAIQIVAFPYAQFLADDTVMERFFGSSEGAALPSTFVFGADGRLRRVFHGAITEADVDRLLLSFRDEGVRTADLSLLGRISFGAGDYDKATEYYGRLATLEPDSLDQVGVAWEHRRAQAQFYLGVARLRSGRPAEAVVDLQAAIRLLGEDHGVLLQLALAAAASGQLDLAAYTLQRVVRVKPDSVPAWINKARVHRAMGEMDAARDSYRRALLLDPRNESARQELAGIAAAVNPSR